MKPPIGLRLAVWMLPADARDDVAGELHERYEQIAAERGRGAARAWAWRQPWVALAARARWDRPVLPAMGGSMLAGFGDDLVLAVRGLGRRRGLATAIVLTVGVSVGATAAIASVIDAVLLRPLPYPDADRIVWMNSYNRSATVRRPGTGPFISASNPQDVADWQARTRAFDAITAIEGFDGTIEAGPEPIRVEVGKVQATAGRVLGIRAAFGRLFTEDDYGAGVRVMVLTDPLWRRSFNADPDIVGRSVPLDGTPFTVVGVLPPTTVPFPDSTVDLWVPLAPPVRTDDPRRRGGTWQGVAGRISSGVTPEAAQADIDRVAAELAAEYPQTNARRAVALLPYRDGLVGSTRMVLWLLSTAILVVLAIASANVGHLLLLSVQARRREFAVRAALGARRARLARLVLAESVVLSAAGGLAGLVAAPWLLHAFLSAYPAELPAVGDVILSQVALVAAGAATLVAALALAVPPLVGAHASDLAQSMRATDRGSDSRGQRRTRAALVVAQVAMSTALLLGGGLLLRTFVDVRATPLGFVPEQVLTFNVALSDTHYASRTAEAAFHRDLADRIRAIPGVTATGSTSLLPLEEGDFIDGFARVGHPEDVFPNIPTARLQNVTPGYLEAMGLAVKAGRPIEATDGEGAAPVAVVNEAFERLYFPDGAVGRQIQFRGAVRDIVGIVSDKRHRTLREEARAELFVPRAQADWPRWFAWVAVRHTGGLESLVPAVRAAVRDVDARVSVDGIGTMADRVDGALAPDRFRAFLVGALAMVAVALAMIGLYGLVAHAVAREARDTAIRIALGAGAGRTSGLVLARVLVLTVAGVTVGLAGAFFGRELLATFVVGVGAGDLWTMMLVACGLLGLATMAASGPALRAGRVDPATVLRGD